MNNGSLFCIGSVLIASWIALDHLWITVATSFSHISLAKIRNNPHNPYGYADFYTNLDKMAGASPLL